MNPLQLTYDAFWRLVDMHKPLQAIKEGNRVKMNVDAPVKEEVATDDLPELRLVVRSVTPHMFRTSNSSSVRMRVEWQLASGSQKYEMVLQLTWELMVALMNWKATLGELTWEGDKIVKIMEQKSGDVGVTQYDLNRGIKGWSTIWACEVELWFNSAKIKGGT